VLLRIVAKAARCVIPLENSPINETSGVAAQPRRARADLARAAVALGSQRGVHCGEIPIGAIRMRSTPASSAAMARPDGASDGGKARVAEHDEGRVVRHKLPERKPIRRFLARSRAAEEARNFSDPPCQNRATKPQPRGCPVGGIRAAFVERAACSLMRRSSRQHDFPDMRARFHQRVRACGIAQREGPVDHRLDLAGRDQRPDVLLDRARNRGLFMHRARAQS
jgi:hypothetical protein